MEQFERTIQMLGADTFERLQRTRVILFGVGGVGGWCAETLIRTGLGHLTIVDFDTINLSNINRQVVATAENIGLSKVEEMRKRLLTICPEADIVALHQRYCAETAGQFDLSRYDYVIDAIDFVEDKMLLIYNATLLPPDCSADSASCKNGALSSKLFSSMGAGRKKDISQIRVAEFWKVQGCPLARALRTKMKKTGLLPQTKFQCVFSPELSADTGTIAPVVGVFGMQLTNLVLQDIQNKNAVG